MKMPSPRVANCQFFDDLRIEVGNKLSLMGMYSTDMTFSPPVEFPIALPKFAVAIWLMTDKDDRPREANIIIELPDGSEFLRTPIVMQAYDPEDPRMTDDSFTKWKIFHAIPISPFPLPCEGFVQVWVEADGARLRAGRLKIQNLNTEAYAIAATASPPPS